MPAIARAVESGQIDVADPWLLPVINQPPEIAGVLAEGSGRCIFHQRMPQRAVSAPPAPPAASAHRCAIQSVLGHGAIPAACHHFPRVCLIDDRGVFVTLSHYCPTAASLLASHDGPVAIVRGPEPVPQGPEGFDARGAWPPLLAPNVLMDLDAYALWESHQIAWLGGERNPDGGWAPEAVLGMLAAQAQRLASWRPGDRGLAQAIRDLATDTPPARDQSPDWDGERQLRAAVLASLPPSQHWDDDVGDLSTIWSRDISDVWRSEARLINRLLAAHAFAAWSAYDADGVVTALRPLQTVLAVLRQETVRICQREDEALTPGRLLDAIRRTDLLLVHLVDRAQLSVELASL